MSSLFGGGGSSVQTPKAPKPIQLNAQNLQTNMVAADQAAYASADAYNNQFYPALTQARDQMIGQAYNAITGPLDPALQNTFVNQGNTKAMGAFGGGDQGFGLSTGSLGRNSAAATVASDEQKYQDYNRSVFENLNATFAPRAYGMTPEDAANVFTFNNTQFNNYLEQQYALATNAYYQNQGLASAAAGQTAGLVGSIGGSLISAAAAAAIAA
jgi:hypothetical protein